MRQIDDKMAADDVSCLLALRTAIVRRAPLPAVLGGYNIVCRKCGDIHGSSESPDPKFLAGFNRNSRAQKARRAASRRG